MHGKIILLIDFICMKSKAQVRIKINKLIEYITPEKSLISTIKKLIKIHKDQIKKVVEGLLGKLKSYFKRIQYWLNRERYYLNKTQQSNLIETIRKKQNLPSDYKNILNKKLTPNWFSKREIFYVSLLLILIFIMLFVKVDINLYDKSINLDRDILISVHTGIGAVLVGLIFLVANSINDMGTKYRRFVLFRRTSLFGLFVLEITTFFLHCLLR